MTNEENKNEELFRIFKYIFSAGSSFLLDLILYTIFNFILKSIILSTIIARILSSFYNYLFNSRIVFKNSNKKTIIKYYCLAVIQMFASAMFVSILSNIFVNINSTIIKFFVDIVIFIVNYIIQKEMVFK